MPSAWDIVTDYGDSAVTLPLALLTLIFLLLSRHYRVARTWVLAIGGCGVAIGALKLVFGACGSRVGIFGIVSPSGHTAISTAVYGALAVLVGAALTPGRRLPVYAGAALLVCGIAVSRAVLHMHDAAEIVVGFAVGLGAVVVFRAALRREPPPALPLGWFALCALGLVVAMHGTRWMVEPAVHQAAGIFRLALPWCR